MYQSGALPREEHSLSNRLMDGVNCYTKALMRYFAFLFSSIPLMGGKHLNGDDDFIMALSSANDGPLPGSDKSEDYTTKNTNRYTIDTNKFPDQNTTDATTQDDIKDTNQDTKQDYTRDTNQDNILDTNQDNTWDTNQDNTLDTNQDNTWDTKQDNARDHNREPPQHVMSHPKRRGHIRSTNRHGFSPQTLPKQYLKYYMTEDTFRELMKGMEVIDHRQATSSRSGSYTNHGYNTGSKSSPPQLHKIYKQLSSDDEHSCLTILLNCQVITEKDTTVSDSSPDGDQMEINRNERTKNPFCLNKKYTATSPSIYLHERALLSALGRASIWLSTLKHIHEISARSLENQGIDLMMDIIHRPQYYAIQFKTSSALLCDCITTLLDLCSNRQEQHLSRNELINTLAFTEGLIHQGLTEMVAMEMEKYHHHSQDEWTAMLDQRVQH